MIYDRKVVLYYYTVEFENELHKTKLLYLEAPSKFFSLSILSLLSLAHLKIEIFRSTGYDRMCGTHRKSIDIYYINMHKVLLVITDINGKFQNLVMLRKYCRSR